MHSWSKRSYKNPSTNKRTGCTTASTTTFVLATFSGHAAPRARSPRSGPSAIPDSLSASMLPASAPPWSCSSHKKNYVATATTKLLVLRVAYHREGLLTLLDIHTKSHWSRVEERKFPSTLDQRRVGWEQKRRKKRKKKGRIIAVCAM